MVTVTGMKRAAVTTITIGFPIACMEIRHEMNCGG